MLEKEILAHVRAKGDGLVAQYVAENFKELANSEELQTATIQFIFEGANIELRALLKTETEHEHRIKMAAVVDYVMEFLNMSGEDEIAQKLQVIYENMFTGIIAEKMWEIANNKVKAN